MLTRRRFIQWGSAALAAGTGTLTYMKWVEPTWLEFNRRRLPLQAGAKPVRLLHLSDLHLGPDVRPRQLRESFQTGLRARPDAICITGDFITGALNQTGTYRDLLRELTDSAPTLACLGNHDGGDWLGRHGGYPNADEVKNLLDGAGVQLLHNRSTRLELRGRSLEFSGIGDLWSGRWPVDQALTRGRTHRDPVILLSHNPDAKSEVAALDWDLMLAGHTHGGQVRFPLLGTPFAPVRDKRYVEGLQPWGHRWIQVSRGIGSLFGLRLNCRPEMVLLEV